MRDAHSTWKVRHTASALDRIAEARRTLGLTVEYYEEWAAEETLLAQTEIAMRDFERLVTDLWPLKDDAASAHPQRRRPPQRAARCDVPRRVGAPRADRVRRGARGHPTWTTSRRAAPAKTMTEEIARATALLEGADDEIKNTAHKRLMTLVRR